MYQVLLILSLVNLLLCIFEVKTLISIIIFIWSFFLFVQNTLQTIIDKGLISYVPYNIKLILLRRSIFDVLCDLWYFSKVKLYAQAIFAPFFLKPGPKDVYKYLSVIPRKERKVFFTKGIAYTLPKRIQNILFPKGKNMHNKLVEFLNNEDDSH